jgi:Tol biopolymer transport system component
MRPALAVCAIVLGWLILLTAPSAQDPAPPRLLLAFASYRDRPRHPNIYFYEHDGVSTGKMAGMVGGTPQRTADAYAHPTLTGDGRLCAFTYELENNTGRIHLWDLKEQKILDLAAVNTSPNAQMGPSFSSTGKLLAFAGWNRPGAPQGWHVFLYDMDAKKLLDLPDVTSPTSDERMPALSADGKFLAYVTNTKTGVGLSDVFLFDREQAKVLPLPEMNSKHLDNEPSLSADGKLIAFVSDRPGGSGGRDIYLFDRQAGKFLPLPGLNSTGHDFSPALSPDGRFLAFVSERLAGEGERDVYLYDRQTQKLLPTPGLNSKADDFDPCVIVLGR